MPASLTKPGQIERHAHAAAVQILAHPLREPAQAELRRGVERRAARADLARERGDEHQLPPPALGHPRQQHSCELHGCAQVDVECAIDLVRREAVERTARRQRGVGHEHVDLSCGLGEAGGAVRVSEVGRQLAVVAAEVLLQLVEHVAAPAGQDQLRAARVQRPRDRLADSAGRAGQQHSRSPEFHAADATGPWA